MKVVAFNGSPNKRGNTYQSIRIVTDELEKKGIETEVVHVGDQIIRGCMACRACGSNKNEKCAFTEDRVNEWIQKMKEADGIILGSPVHYSAIGGTMKSFLDRAFQVATANKSMLRHKVGAAVVAVRRSGGVPTYQQLNQFITFSEMLMPTSNYWNVIHGYKSGEINQDEEGKQIMKTLGKNMAWLMALIEYGRNKVEEPTREEKVLTNFIR